MTILLVTNDLLGSSGWSVYALNIISEAIRKGYNVHVVVHRKTPDLIPGITQYEVLPSPHAVVWNLFHIALMTFRMRGLLATISPEVLHVMVEPYVQAWAFIPIRGYKLILTVHGTYARLPATAPAGIRRLLSKYIWKMALLKVNDVIAVSQKTKDIFCTNVVDLAIKNRVQVIRNSTQLIGRTFDESAESTVNEARVVLTTGSVKHRKGIHIAIPLLSEWAKKRTLHVTYHVVGAFDVTSVYGACVQLLSEKYVHPYFKVVFHGDANRSVDERVKIDILKQADMYIHLEDVSMHDDIEGFGIGIIEAAMYGVPALVAQGSATTEAVCNNQSGYLIDIHDKKSIINAIDRILFSRLISPVSVRQWAERHSPEVVFPHIEKLYQKGV